MSNEVIGQQTQKLFAHMKDYLQAEKVSKKAEAAIFDKHRQPDGGYSAGLKDELNTCRQNFANEWGSNGWRNEQFVKKQMDEMQRPTEEDVSKMYQAEQSPERQQFLDQLQAKKQNSPKPKPR